MKRTIAAAATAVVALLVSSCSVSTGESGTVTVTEYVSAEETSAGTTPALNDEHSSSSDSAAAEPDAFHFDSGTLEIGPFDPDEVYPNVFDPCKEISDEEFAELGFTKWGDTVSSAAGSALGCSLIPDDDSNPYTYGLAGNVVSPKEIIEQSADYRTAESSILPDVVLASTPADNREVCRAYVSTSRGHLQADVGIFRDAPQISYDHLCTEAITLLENLKGS